MGMKSLKCPSCNENIEIDDSREFGFCSYCGTKIQINENNGANNDHALERNNTANNDHAIEKDNIANNDHAIEKDNTANNAHTTEKVNTEELWQKAQHCMDISIIGCNSVIEGLEYGQMVIESFPVEKRQGVVDKFVKMYTECMIRLGHEMVATIKTYNHTERNTIAVQQTHDVLKSMLVAPYYFQYCSLQAVEVLESTCVQICYSLSGWAKKAAKVYNNSEAYCANVQRMAQNMRGSMPVAGNGGGYKPVKAWYKRWWAWVSIAVILLAVGFMLKQANVQLFSGINFKRNTTPTTNNNVMKSETQKKAVEEEKTTEKKDPNSCEYRGLKARYKRCEIVDDGYDNPVLFVYFDFTNNSDENEKFYMNFHPKIFENGIEVNDIAISMAESKAKDNYAADIKPGTTAEVAVLFKVPDSFPVNLEVSPLFSPDDVLMSIDIAP